VLSDSLAEEAFRAVLGQPRRCRLRPPIASATSFRSLFCLPIKTASKPRPAVVVSAEAYQQRRPDLIVMAVTSQTLRPAGAPGEVLISDWQGAGRPKASLIKPVLATIEQRLLLRKLGAL
jgi:mRNA-degrading endonuclease toxin of MazEF toxin-antitoxin module